MKPIINTLIILLLYSLAFSQTGTICAEISGFKNNTGLVRIVLFNQSKGFPSGYQYGLLAKSQPIDSSLITVIFDSLTYGEYAVSVLHDENKNGKIDNNFLGIPREGYGVSNNVNPMLRPPRFTEARFSLQNIIKIVKITLYYR
jgi:uncharacterized protein (DUF2141 family)